MVRIRKWVEDSFLEFSFKAAGNRLPSAPVTSVERRKNERREEKLLPPFPLYDT